MFFVFQKMHYGHFQEAGVIYSTFNLKYKHEIISIRRHYNIKKKATICTMLVGQGRFGSTQFACK